MQGLNLLKPMRKFADFKALWIKGNGMDRKKVKTVSVKIK
jgi:hypothetical protein